MRQQALQRFPCLLLVVSDTVILWVWVVLLHMYDNTPGHTMLPADHSD